jgi:crotonobetainyl-CoA:carnitine CoA-transferase CaiB-like acyl-CoA transferase
MAGKALHGVLEFGSLIGAPFCGTLMAEFVAPALGAHTDEVLRERLV